jgi:hypothetical protein
MATEFSENSEHHNKKYYCSVCDYLCSKKQHIKQHFLTQSHKKAEFNRFNAVENSVNNNEIIRKFKCSCGKSYKDRSGLWKHSKICHLQNSNLKEEIITNEETNDEIDNNQTKKNNSNNDDLTDKQLIAMLIKENSEFKNLMLEVLKNNISINNSNNTTNNTNTTNSHNKTFNLNVFLNEECKDALNMSDFLSSFKVELSDLETTGRLGFVEGITRLLSKNLRALEQSKRPIHCSDLKRETLYIKDNDKWEKEPEDKTKIKHVIREVANENIKKIADWMKQHPGCRDADSRKNDLFLKIMSNAMCGGSSEETEKNLNNIIRNIVKEVAIDKGMK